LPLQWHGFGIFSCPKGGLTKGGVRGFQLISMVAKKKITYSKIFLDLFILFFLLPGLMELLTLCAPHRSHLPSVQPLIAAACFWLVVV
jgi:hypothetical protein